MVTVETPASFQWNEINKQWVKNYLILKESLLNSITNGEGLDINSMDEAAFTEFCHLLETTAEGRELRNKMFKAWRSKKSRDSNNGKKMYTFNLSIKAGEQLKKVAKNAPLNQTLESLIFAGKINNDTNDQKNLEELKQYKSENVELKQLLTEYKKNTPPINDDQYIAKLIESDLQVTELAKLEKSKLIKQILLLKRKLKEQ